MAFPDSAELDLSLLHTNQRLLVEELKTRGAVIRAVDYSLELLEVSYHENTQLLLDRSSKVAAYLPSTVAADKWLIKYVLQKANIVTPEGRIFEPSQKNEAADYAKTKGFPLVIKPNTGSSGRFVHSGIENAEQFTAALDQFLLDTAGRDHFLVERHIEGHEYRIFITTKGDYAVLLREPAHVTGDGESTIRVLAERETARRLAIKEKEGSALCPVALDQVALNFLRRRHMDFDSVPARGEKLYLRLSSNLSQGGVSKDMTDEVHPSAVAIAKKALDAFDGLPCLGIDFLTPDITADQSALPHAIIEVNANPGLSMHHMPAIGQKRNVAAYMADVMFPHIGRNRV